MLTMSLHRSDSAPTPYSAQPSPITIDEKTKSNNGNACSHKAFRASALTRSSHRLDPNLPAKPNFTSSTPSMATTSSTYTGPTAATASHNSSSDTYSQIVYTNPTTGISFTRQELYEYGQGRKTNERGDVVFFRPSFVDEDPWRTLKNKKQGIRNQK